MTSVLCILLSTDVFEINAGYVGVLCVIPVFVETHQDQEFGLLNENVRCEALFVSCQRNVGCSLF